MESFDVKKPFGTSVRLWRSRLKISQEELAGRAGLHRTYICDVERGARNVTLESIEKLANALEISVSTLLAYRRESSTENCPERVVTDELVDILYIEDNLADIELATESLKNITNRVHVVRDGLAALHYLFGEHGKGRTKPHPQLILLDLGLPKVDGLAVLRRIKSDPCTAKIPVIVLTASVRARDLQVSKHLGAEAYIVKPVGLQNLTEVTPRLNLHWALLKSAAPPPGHPGPRPA